MILICGLCFFSWVKKAIVRMLFTEFYTVDVSFSRVFRLGCVVIGCVGHSCLLGHVAVCCCTLSFTVLFL